MSLDGARVALLIEDDYQEMEAWYPRLRLEEAGADVTVVGPGTRRPQEQARLRDGRRRRPPRTSAPTTSTP